MGPVMDEANPYSTPRTQISEESRRPSRAMSVASGFRIVITSGIGFGAGGMLIGYILGRAAPSYYRAVFGARNDPGFDPVQVGIGLGLTQGSVCGILVGAAVVLASAISLHRRDR